MAAIDGNVWEWTSSIYKDYPYKASDGREDPNDTGSPRVLRGGGWHDPDRSFRSAVRYYGTPAYCYGINGFRVCLSSVAPK